MSSAREPRDGSASAVPSTARGKATTCVADACARRAERVTAPLAMRVPTGRVTTRSLGWICERVRAASKGMFSTVTSTPLAVVAVQGMDGG